MLQTKSSVKWDKIRSHLVLTWDSKTALEIHSDIPIYIITQNIRLKYILEMINNITFNFQLLSKLQLSNRDLCHRWKSKLQQYLWHHDYDDLQWNQPPRRQAVPWYGNPLTPIAIKCHQWRQSVNFNTFVQLSSGFNKL